MLSKITVTRYITDRNAKVGIFTLIVKEINFFFANWIKIFLNFRLTKYPLLFENLAKYSKSYPDEEKNVRRALKRSKEILNRIDEAVREAADRDQIAEILRKLDTSALEKNDPQQAAEFKVSYSFSQE